MELEVIDTKLLKFHKKPRAVFQGYLYIFQKRCNRYCRWKCCRLITHGCMCVLKTSLDKEKIRVVAVDHEHSHPDDTKAIIELKMLLVMNDSMGNQKSWFKLMKEKKEKENKKHFIPEDVTISRKSNQIIMTKEHFNVSFDYGSSKNINLNPKVLDFQINKFKAAYRQNEIEKNNNNPGAKNYDENIEERTATDNHISFSDSSSSDKTYPSILRNILTSKNNYRKISTNISITKKENPYTEMLRKKIKDMFLNAQMKTNVLETGIENNANTKNNAFDMNNCKRIYSKDTDFINNNSKRICVDKIQSSINSKPEYNDINSIHNDNKTIHFVRDDNTNNTCNINMIEPNTSINGDKKIHVDINKDNNTKVEFSDIPINGRKIVHVNDDEYDKTNVDGDIISIFKNGFSSNNVGNIIQNLNDSNIGKKVFNNLLQTLFISHIIYSSDFGYQLKVFKTRNNQWKKKFDNLVLDMIQMKKDCKRLINRNKCLRKCVKLQMRDTDVQFYNKDAKEVKASKQFFNHENNPKIMPNITQSITSETANSEVICSSTLFNQVNTDVIENIESKVLNSNFTPKSSQINPNVTEKVESIVLNPKFTSECKTLKTVNSVLQNQRVPKEKIEDNSSATTIPLITKYIPKEPVLGINSKNKFKKISLGNMIKILKSRHFSNTKTFNCKLFYAMIEQTNTKPISKIIEEKNVKNLSNGIVVLEKRSLPDVVQSSQVFKNNCYSHNRKRHSNYQKIMGFTSKSVHLRILHEEIIRYNSNKIFGPFLENITDAERYLHPPPLKLAVFVSFMTNPPKAVLKWNVEINIQGNKIIENIIDYEIAIIAFRNNKLISGGWQKLGLMKALQLPMTCTIQLEGDNSTIYYFAIRAIDVNKRYGPYCISSPVVI